MYQKFFSLKQRPFRATPQLGVYFPASGLEEAIATLRYAITQGRGLALLTGMPGTGKTLACQRLLTELEPSFTTAMLTNTNMTTVKGLLQAILHDLTLPYHGMDEQELRLTLSDFLAGKHVGGSRVALIIDEAQNLSLPLLEEIRMLSNIEADGEKLLNLVLVGHPRLINLLRRPELEALNQRIGARAMLDSLTNEETFGYIRHQLQYAGVTPERIFTDEAMAVVHDTTGGVPRLINQLCDHALLLAFLSEVTTVDAEIVLQAHEDLNRQGDQSVNRVTEQPLNRSTEQSVNRLPEQSAIRIPLQAVTPLVERAIDLNTTSDILSPMPAIDEGSVIQFSTFEQTPAPEPVRFEECRPSDETFEDEEVIVDQYAIMDAAKASRQLPRQTGRKAPIVQPATPAAAPEIQDVSIARSDLASPSILTNGDVSTTLAFGGDYTLPASSFVEPTDEPAVYEVGAGVESQELKQIGESQPSLLVIEERSKRSTGNRTRLDAPQSGTARGNGAYRRLFTHARKS